MNEQDRTLDAADDRALDLLVDGELTDEQTRWLLAALDESSDGWRRCALSFVEAQSWNRDLSAIRHTSLAGEADPTVQVAPSRRIAPKRLVPLLLTVTASILIALASGIGIGQSWRAPTPAPIAETSPTETTPHTASRPMDGGANSSNDAGEPFQLPVYLASQVSEDYLQDTPPPLSARLQRALARSGHEAKMQRQWIPLQLEDGSQIVFPVDQVQLHYVGNQSYQ